MNEQTEINARDDVSSIGLLCAELLKMKKRLEKRKIPHHVMTSWDRQGCEAWNEGLDFAISDIERTIKRKKKAHNILLSAKFG